MQTSQLSGKQEPEVKVCEKEGNNPQNKNMPKMNDYCKETLMRAELLQKQLTLVQDYVNEMFQQGENDIYAIKAIRGILIQAINTARVRIHKDLAVIKSTE